MSYRTLLPIVFLSLFFSCQIENLEQKKKQFAQKRAKEKREERLLEKQRLLTAEIDLLPALTELSKKKSANCGLITMVNGLPIDSDKPMPIRSDIITFKGFAYDKSTMNVAGGAIITIDDEEYEVSEWTARKKFAEKKGQELLMTGFNYIFDATSLGVGRHKVNLFVVTSDKKQYYDSKREFEFELIKN